jgi:hypothetical protein
MPKVTFDYLASLEWSRAAENTCLIGPAGTGKSHISRGAGRRRRRSRTSGAVLHRRGARRNALSSTRRQQRRQSARRPATQRPDHLRRTRLRATRRHRNPAPLLIDPIVGVTGAGTVGGVRPPNTGSHRLTLATTLVTTGVCRADPAIARQQSATRWSQPAAAPNFGRRRSDRRADWRPYW